MCVVWWSKALKPPPPGSSPTRDVYSDNTEWELSLSLSLWVCVCVCVCVCPAEVTSRADSDTFTGEGAGFNCLNETMHVIDVAEIIETETRYIYIPEGWHSRAVKIQHVME